MRLMFANITGLFEGVALGALPLTLLLFLRSAVDGRWIAGVGFCLAVLLTLRAHRTMRLWVTGIIVGFGIAWTLWGGDWRLALYVFVVPELAAPIAAGVMTGLILDRWKA